MDALLEAPEGGLNQPADTAKLQPKRYLGVGQKKSSSGVIIYDNHQLGSPDLVAAPNDRPPALV